MPSAARLTEQHADRETCKQFGDTNSLAQNQEAISKQISPRSVPGKNELGCPPIAGLTAAI